MDANRAVPAGSMNRHPNGLLDPFVTLPGVRKLTYFTRVADQRPRTRYAEGPCGPCARNPQHPSLRRIGPAADAPGEKGRMDGGSFALRR